MAIISMIGKNNELPGAGSEAPFDAKQVTPNVAVVVDDESEETESDTSDESEDEELTVKQVESENATGRDDDTDVDEYGELGDEEIFEEYLVPCAMQRAVRFAAPVVTQVHVRPRTLPEEKATLFYNKRDFNRFRQEVYDLYSGKTVQFVEPIVTEVHTIPARVQDEEERRRLYFSGEELQVFLEEFVRSLANNGMDIPLQTEADEDNEKFASVEEVDAPASEDVVVNDSISSIKDESGMENSSVEAGSLAGDTCEPTNAAICNNVGNVGPSCDTVLPKSEGATMPPSAVDIDALEDESQNAEESRTTSQSEEAIRLASIDETSSPSVGPPASTTAEAKKEQSGDCKTPTNDKAPSSAQLLPPVRPQAVEEPAKPQEKGAGSAQSSGVGAIVEFVQKKQPTPRKTKQSAASTLKAKLNPFSRNRSRRTV